MPLQDSPHLYEAQGDMNYLLRGGRHRPNDNRTDPSQSCKQSGRHSYRREQAIPGKADATIGGLSAFTDGYPGRDMQRPNVSLFDLPYPVQAIHMPAWYHFPTAGK